LLLNYRLVCDDMPCMLFLVAYYLMPVDDL
jgi:hypothetical protein